MWVWVVLWPLVLHAFFRRPGEIWPYALVIAVSFLVHFFATWGLPGLVLIAVLMAFVCLGLLVMLTLPEDMTFRFQQKILGFAGQSLSLAGVETVSVSSVWRGVWEGVLDAVHFLKHAERRPRPGDSKSV